MRSCLIACAILLWAAHVHAEGPATAVCKNAAGDSRLIQAALDTHGSVHITGPCHGDAAIMLSTPGQHIYGDGQTNTVITVTAPLPGGLFVAHTGEPGPRIEDLGVTFTQPDTAARAELTDFSPAFSLRDTPRFQLRRIRITRPMIGIDMRGNSGGAIIDDVEQSPLSIGIWIDGSLDSVRITDAHVWPFGLTPKQMALFTAVNDACAPQTTSGHAGAIGILSGRMDDLKIQGGLLFVGQALCFMPSADRTNPGPTFAQINGTDFDTYGGIKLNQAGGLVTIAASFFSIGDNAYSSIIANEGSLNCAGCQFLDGMSGSTPIILIDGHGGPPSVTITGSTFMQDKGDVSAIVARTVGTLNVSGTQFSRAPNVGYTKPMISAGIGSRVTVTGNQANDKGAGSGVFIEIAKDDFHNVTGNMTPGWAFVFPPLPAAPSGVYACNSGHVAGCTR